jgi:hypothetical protein
MNSARISKQVDRPGLWFRFYNGAWSSTFPREPGYGIYYDGIPIAQHDKEFWLVIFDEHPFTIKLKSKFQRLVSTGEAYSVGRLLSIDDFEIVENRNYKKQRLMYEISKNY